MKRSIVFLNEKKDFLTSLKDISNSFFSTVGLTALEVLIEIFYDRLKLSAKFLCFYVKRNIEHIENDPKLQNSTYFN